MAQASKQCGSASSECTTSYKQTIIYTTFLETESHCFKELVQKHTGVSEGEKLPVTMPAKKPRRGSPVAGLKSDGNGFALIRSGTDVGPQKSAFKLHHRRQFHKRLEMKLGLSHDTSTPKLAAGNDCMLSATLNPSPCTPLGPVDPFTCSSTSYCYNYSPSCCSTPSSNQSPYLEEQDEEFCFEASAIRVKREPELLPLFPLHSPTKPRT